MNRHIATPLRRCWLATPPSVSACILITAISASAATPAPDAITGNYYELESSTAKWDAARFDAKGRILAGIPGHLVAIGDVRENQIVRALGGTVEKWIGLTDSGSVSSLDGFDLSTLGTIERENTSSFPLPAPGMTPGATERGGGFEWLTTEPFTYHNWQSGEPNNDFGADAVFMIVSGQWQDTDGGMSIGQAEPFGPVLKRYVIEWEYTPDQGKFQITERKAAASFNGGTGDVATLTHADDLLALPFSHADVAAEQRAEAYVVSFHDPDFGGGLVNYTRTPFLTDLPGTNDENFAWRASGYVKIPSAGDWTFGVASGEPFRLEVGGNVFIGAGVLASDPPRLTRSSTGTLTAVAGGSGDAFYFPSAGIYRLVLTGFESQLAAFNQLFAAQGAQTVFDSANFELVGNELFGGLEIIPCPVDLELSIAVGPGGVGYRLSWDGVPGNTYRVEFTTDLEDWNEISGDINGAAATTFDHVPAEPKGFYRIIRKN